jgi:hypothetical protein
MGQHKGFAWSSPKHAFGIAEERMKSKDVDDDEFKNVNAGQPLILIPEGIYPARLVGKEIKRTPWGEKLVLTWEVFTSPDFRDAGRRNDCTVLLQRYYNIKRDKGKLVLGPHSNYHKDWIAANKGRHPEPRHSLPPSVFQNGFLFVEVTTVKKDSTSRLHSSLHYSKVQRIIRPVDEDEKIKRLPLQLDDIA